MDKPEARTRTNGPFARPPGGGPPDSTLPATTDKRRSSQRCEQAGRASPNERFVRTPPGVPRIPHYRGPPTKRGLAATLRPNQPGESERTVRSLASPGAPRFPRYPRPPTKMRLRARLWTSRSHEPERMVHSRIAGIPDSLVIVDHDRTRVRAAAANKPHEPERTVHSHASGGPPVPHYRGPPTKRGLAATLRPNQPGEPERTVRSLAAPGAPDFHATRDHRQKLRSQRGLWTNW